MGSYICIQYFIKSMLFQLHAVSQRDPDTEGTSYFLFMAPGSSNKSFMMKSQITSLTVVYSNVYSGAYQRKHQNSASQAFVRGIHRWPVNYPHKGPVTRKIFPFDDVIMNVKKIYDNRETKLMYKSYPDNWIIRCDLFNLSCSNYHGHDVTLVWIN